MAIKYFKYKRKVFSQGVVTEIFHPKMQLEVPIGFEQIAEMIEEKSTMSRGDVLGCLQRWKLRLVICWKMGIL